MVGPFTNHGGSLLQIEKSSATRWARNIFCLRHPVSSSLQNPESCFVTTIGPAQRFILRKVIDHTKHYSVTEAINKQTSYIGSCMDTNGIFVSNSILPRN